MTQLLQKLFITNRRRCNDGCCQEKRLYAVIALTVARRKCREAAYVLATDWSLLLWLNEPRSPFSTHIHTRSALIFISARFCIILEWIISGIWEIHMQIRNISTAWTLHTLCMTPSKTMWIDRGCFGLIVFYHRNQPNFGLLEIWRSCDTFACVTSGVF